MPACAINQLTVLELPDGTSPRSRDGSDIDHPLAEEEEWAKYGLPEDDGAGMGRRRMAILKLGAWMNPHAIGSASRFRDDKRASEC